MAVAASDDIFSMMGARDGEFTTLHGTLVAGSVSRSTPLQASVALTHPTGTKVLTLHARFNTLSVILDVDGTVHQHTWDVNELCAQDHVSWRLESQYDHLQPKDIQSVLFYNNVGIAVVGFTNLFEIWGGDHHQLNVN